jgi:hypothetical protein
LAGVRKEARQRGGHHSRKPVVVLAPTTPDLPLTNADDVLAMLQETANEVRRGQIDARVANTVAFIASVALRAMSVAGSRGHAEVSKMQAAYRQALESPEACELLIQLDKVMSAPAVPAELKLVSQPVESTMID